MSKKTLSVDGIRNELKGSSLFFRPHEDSPTPSSPPIELSTEPTEISHDEPNNQYLSNGNGLSKHATIEASTLDSKQASTNSSFQASNHDFIKTIRKAVRHVGKETLFLRVTAEEKRILQSIVFSFNEKHRGEGFKTSENEIGRIAINVLLKDHQSNSSASVLNRTLAALQA